MNETPPSAAPRYRVAVRELCEFTAKQGSLDLRFTPAPTALEGMAGHALVADRRGEGYRAELSLSGDYQSLHVRGRADGYQPELQRLEEIKTYKGRLQDQPDSHRRLHWAQAKIYGWLLCQQEGLDELEVALVYFHVGSQQETLLSERCPAAELRLHFEQHCKRFLAWAEQEVAHRRSRDAALQALQFPFGEFRAGQRQLAEAVYRAAQVGRCLLAEAPTGIGKTAGTLFPLLKAAPAQRLDKIFFLAAKTSGRQLALDALEALDATGLRRLEMVARDKACEHPDKACHGDSCPLALGFYDRLPGARAAAVAQAGALDQARVRELALQHEVCPYYLSQELARWADVVVGDYNYYFDLSALLHGLAQANQWRVGLLVDEAHNLVERGRKMYTAELLPDSLAQARRSPAARAHPALKKALDKLARAWRTLDKAQTEPYRVYEAIPEPLLNALQACSGAITEHFSEHPAESDAALQTFYFEALHWGRMAELLDSHSLVDLSRPAAAAVAGNSTLCIRNIVPAPFLRPRLEAAHTSTLFSATLQPRDYYADLLGLPETHATLQVGSPFEAAQLQVHISRTISTRYPDRRASLAPIAALIARQYAQQPGNYLAFFSSYDYLQQVAERLASEQPQLPIWIQSRRMLEAERQQFLARFAEEGAGIGFAVLGGAFSEGIDLPGRRLIGAFVATLGLPQINAVNEQIRQRMQTMFGTGYDYTYLFPGLQKVVQAAGRVIRTPSDRGVLHLIDDRFAQPQVKRLLPPWWALGSG
ncbi:ATP-dependent DNA helicase [Paucibacter sp. PLA-PC-4]|uniref:ATP-dependent DNA helicase n=1 Tax=Paucibacter sp. PLA-PC-4 TaxID=2993655 RepID=UPI00224948B8|nr:ATP-dependent DNA helicase [Paucibacter sp. PLA-PC-4]MCX2861735.1 ATP-dependent DNA helicase [Paucibacter sp. PLA-PC-4]